MLLCGLRGVLYLLILTWFSSRGKAKSKNKGRLCGRSNLFTWNKDIQTYGYRLLEEIDLSEISTMNIQMYWFKHFTILTPLNYNPTLPLLVCISLGKSTTDILNFFTYEIEKRVRRWYLSFGPTLLTELEGSDEVVKCGQRSIGW